MELLREMLSTFEDPRTAHAALGHTPIALSVLGIPLLIALLTYRARNATLRVIALVVYLAFAGGAWMAESAGERAEGRAGQLASDVRAVLEKHEEMGELTPWLGLLVALFIGGAWLKNAKLAVTSLCLALAGGLFTAGWIAVTAHYGGSLVYEHGVGTPRTAFSSASPASFAEGDPRLAHWNGSVQPLLAARCYGCHGEARKAGGELDLTSMEGMLKGGESGPAIVPGDAERSPLWRAVSWAEEHLKMPLDEPQLSAEEMEAIRTWINAGAAWAP